MPNENTTEIVEPAKNLLRRVVNKKTVVTTLAVVGAVVVLKAVASKLSQGEDASLDIEA